MLCWNTATLSTAQSKIHLSFHTFFNQMHFTFWFLGRISMLSLTQLFCSGLLLLCLQRAAEIKLAYEQQHNSYVAVWQPMETTWWSKTKNLKQTCSSSLNYPMCPNIFNSSSNRRKTLEHFLGIFDSIYIVRTCCWLNAFLYNTQEWRRYSPKKVRIPSPSVCFCLVLFYSSKILMFSFSGFSRLPIFKRKERFLKQ